MKKNIVKFALLGFLVAIVAFSWLRPLDATAERQIEEGLDRALASFAAARLLNGVISVAQGTEVSIAPGGLGANLAPGQILDPVNDLVEQFSELMLIASVAFGIMKILLGIGSFWVFSAVLSGVALAWAMFKLTDRIPPILLTKLLLVLIFVRFSIPVATVGSDMVFKQFMAEKFEKSQKQLASLTYPLQSEVTQPAEERGWLDRLRDEYDPRPHIQNLETQAGKVVDHIIDLIAVFVLQTIAIPLVLIWALYRSCLTLMRSAGRER